MPFVRCRTKFAINKHIKRGRPPKSVQPEVVSKEKSLEIEEITVDEQSDDQDNDDDVSSVDDIVEIERDEE